MDSTVSTVTMCFHNGFHTWSLWMPRFPQVRVFSQQFPHVEPMETNNFHQFVCFHKSVHAWSLWTLAISIKLCVFTIVSTCEAYAYQQFPNVCVLSQLFPQIRFVIANIFHFELKSIHRNELAHWARRMTNLETHQQLASALQS